MAIDNKSGSIFGLFSSADSSNFSVNSSPGLSQLSPYLNVDPTYVTAQPEFLTLEGASQKRGRFELAFSQTGAACLIGGALGGSQGIYRALKDTQAQGHVGKIKRTQLINYFTKHGTTSAHTLGSISVLYAGLGCIIYLLRGKTEDGLNTIGAATLTGALYKSTSGLRKCGLGGAIGLVLSSLYVAAFHKDEFKQGMRNVY